MSSKAQRYGVSSIVRITLELAIYSDACYSQDAQTNPRGIPYAPFVDKVEDYVSSRAEVDGTMKSFQEMISCASTDFPSVMSSQLSIETQQIPIHGS